MLSAKLKIVVMALVLYGLIGASTALAQDKEAKEEAKGLLTGVLKGVDAEANTILIHLSGDPPNIHKSYRLAKDIRVSVADKQAKISELKAGMRVHVKLSDDETRVLSVSAVPGRGDAGRDEERPSVRGLLKSVQADKIVVTIQRDGEQPHDKTLPLARNVRVRLSEKEGKVADLRTGMRIQATLSADDKEVIAVVATAGRPAGRQRDADRGALRAVLKEIKGDKIIVTIPREGEQVQEKAFTLSKKVQVSTQSKEAAQLADLRPGSMVALTLSNDQREVTAIRELSRRRDN